MRPEAGISAVILTRGRPALLAACLRSFAAEPPDEVLVGLDGGAAGSAPPPGAFPGVKFLPLPRRCRGEARNALAARASGRWLCFLDDDVLPPPGYFPRLRRLIAGNPGVAVFGGGQRPADGAAYFERAVCALLASRWASGPYRARFAPAGADRRAGPEEFILCNLVLDSRRLEAAGAAFEGHLSSAEENLLLNRLAAAGEGMLLSGGLDVSHRVRSGPAAFAAQIFTSGRGRGQATALRREGFGAFTLLPPAALVLGAAGAVLAPGLLCAAVVLYLAVSAAAALAADCGAAEKPAVFLLYPLLHAAYAAGWLYGFFEELIGRLRGAVRPARCRCEDVPAAPPR